MAMNTYHEYPKTLRHPQHQDAVWETLNTNGKPSIFGGETRIISTEKFPNVTVSNLQQEQQYAAKGYRPANLPDPAEYERAILDAQPGAGPEFQAYPKFKYHKEELSVIVNNEAEEKALGAGWSDSPIFATEEDLVEIQESPVMEAGPTDEPPLVEQPIEKPVKIDKRRKEHRAA